MDAHNLAIVLTPNLVASGNPLKDVAICGVAGAPEPLSPSSRSSAPAHPAAAEVAKHEGRTTLGTIIKLCIARYFEVFDEIADRADAIAAEAFELGAAHDAPPASSSPSPEPQLTAEVIAGAKRRSLLQDDDSIDDGMLVMPVGPSSASPSTSPTARRFPGVGSVASAESRGASAARLAALGTMSRAKARSLLTPSASDPVGLSNAAASRRGTLARGAGRGGSGPPSAAGTLRSKSTGAGVAAHSVTASGFFTPPSDAPPVPPVPPPLHPSSARRVGGGES